jgi:hypothetical protein
MSVLELRDGHMVRPYEHSSQSSKSQSSKYSKEMKRWY